MNSRILFLWELIRFSDWNRRLNLNNNSYSYFPGAQTVKHLPAMQTQFDPWVGKSPWQRGWQPTLIFLPGESHGQRSLVGYSPRGRRVGEKVDSVKFPIGLADMSICMLRKCMFGCYPFHQNSQFSMGAHNMPMTRRLLTVSAPSVQQQMFGKKRSHSIKCIHRYKC